jgi:hypothetical protein
MRLSGHVRKSARDPVIVNNGGHFAAVRRFERLRIIEH